MPPLGGGSASAERGLYIKAVIIYYIFSYLQQMTKMIVIFLVKYLHDYKNSHIFVLKDWQKQAEDKGRRAEGIFSVSRAP